MLIVNLRGFLIYILQSTNKIKEYARVTIFDRLLYILLIILFLLSGGRNYKLIIIIDLLGKFISLIFAMIVCKRLVFLNIRYFKINFIETYTNISVGIKLMISNIASMLIVGVVRFGIERTWDITTFGKVSLTLSISNLLMLFINALGIIMFPVLRRTDKNSLPSIYIMMRDLLMAVMFGMLIFYYPAKEVLTIWLPDYAESLKYMALLFPLSVYEGKMALLVNTYFKTLRKEKLMLRINILVMSLSMLTTIVTTIAFKKLDIAVFSIVLLLMLRAVISEVAISKILNLYLLKDILLELTLTFAFIISGWYFDSILTLIIYLGFYLTYLVIKRKDLIVTKDKIKSIIFSKES
jgi:O-antigen/teichoic acid export membrane protein